MEESAVARDLAAVIAQEIAAQLGVHRPVEEMPSLIADAILDVFQVQPRRQVEFRLTVKRHDDHVVRCRRLWPARCRGGWL